eukprot:CAMPEP_0168483238 /NCGR_PEP_ID=MMETSP0228-20121227/65464_1 /TAXON_ID=133427 /ORGANISM="Protoceratium reticulatum, Strain CCCM 535 (=CCMP 1889)" /LENGTH=129 /DNA_ID=CAMNT_0008499711 /DNA_START=30 /DNA_END=416 /DNA_ORIENTATION=-
MAQESTTETVKDIYWRLGQPWRGKPVEAYWKPEDDWLPARVDSVVEDGLVKVKWTDGRTSELPSRHVRNVGEGDLVGGQPSLKKYLRDARPDWKEEDLGSVFRKLRGVAITDARSLRREVAQELAGMRG